jgi:MoaA/NifB/PqqE/SkfB family radical SAM enzyme
MEPDVWLVLAPYVAERRLKGRAVFIRLDPSRPQHTAVVATEAVRRVLRQFQAGAVVADVERTVPPAVRGEWSTAVDELSAGGFLLGADSLGAPRPSLEIEITNRCNADCLMCPRRELRPLGSMTEATFQAVEALSASAGGAILSGIGEPTLHSRLVEWCGRLHAALPAGAPLAIVTNGARMTAELLDALGEAGVSLVQFSLHSLDVDRSNGIMGWSRHDTAVRNLVECARRRPDLLSVNMVLLDSNAGEVEAMHRFVAGLGLPESRLGLIPVFSRAGTVDPGVLSIRPAPPTPGHCLYLRKSLFVAWNGDLLPCSNDVRGRFSWGNVAGEDPGRIVTRWWRELALAPPGFDMCRACDHHSRDTIPTAWFEAVGR